MINDGRATIEDLKSAFAWASQVKRIQDTNGKLDALAQSTMFFCWACGLPKEISDEEYEIMKETL